jgi:hypothetical protein
MMKMGHRAGLVVAGIGFALIAGATSRAFAATILGNFNLRIDGYEVLTPTGGAAEKDDIDGVGQLNVTSAGAITGAETFTSVNSNAGTEDVCNGTVAGTIFAPSGAFASGAGNFAISLTYTPTSTGLTCIPSTSTLQCSRALLHVNNAGNLGAGEYRCVVTGVTAGSGAAAAVDGAAMRDELTLTRGTNAPTN